MPAERLSMRKVREVLRLKHALGMSYRKISEATVSQISTLKLCLPN